MTRIRRGYVRLPTGLIHLRYGGRGEPLVVLHDAGQSSAAAERHGLLAHLGERYRVYAPDLPGHGRSDPLPEALTLDALAATVRAVASELGDRSIRVLGVGLGAIIGARLAADRSIVPALVCAFPPETPTSESADIPDGRRFTMRFSQLMARLAEHPGGAEEASSLVLEEAVAGDHGRHATALRHGADLAALLGPLETPALLMATLDDPQFDVLSEIAGRNAHIDLALSPRGLLFGAFEPETFKSTVVDVF